MLVYIPVSKAYHHYGQGIAMLTLIWRFSKFNTQSSNTTPQMKKMGLQDSRRWLITAHSQRTFTSQRTILILRASRRSLYLKPDNREAAMKYTASIKNGNKKLRRKKEIL